MRVLANFAIYGTEKALAWLLTSRTKIPLTMRQIGTRRIDASLDEWVLSSPYYELTVTELNLQMSQFMVNVSKSFERGDFNCSGVERSVIYFIPVRESEDDDGFRGVIDPIAIKLLADLGCHLEVAPEVTMPEGRMLPQHG